MKKTLLLILLAAMIPALSKRDTCEIIGNGFEGAHSVVYYNEAYGRMDTCLVADGHFELACRRSSELILPMAVIRDSEDEAVGSISRFYIVPDSRHITVVPDICVTVLGSRKSSDINAILDVYDSFYEENINAEEAFKGISTIYRRHTNDIVGVQAFILSWMMDVDMPELVGMYNEGGRFIRDNGSCNICWRSFNEDLYMFGQPVKEIKKSRNGRYALSNVMTFEECAGIIDKTPDDYKQVWKALGTLHLFYPDRSLPFETRLAEKGNAVACMCMIRSLGHKPWTDEEFRTVISSLEKCTRQEVDDFAKEYCCLMARQIYADPGHFDEDSTCYYYEKAKSVRDVMPKGPREWLTYAIPIRNKRNIAARINGEGDAVDLGLSVRWRNRNLGADSISDCGGSYSWGDVEAMADGELSNEDEWKAYKWCDGSRDGIFKYCTSIFEGNAVDCRVELLPQDDAASHALGDGWRTPTISEWEELLNPENCCWEWTCLDGMNGYRVTSKIPGFTGASIFLPAPDKNEFRSHYSDEYKSDEPYYRPIGGYKSDVGRYWSSSLFIVSPDASYYIGLSQNDMEIMGYPRSRGLSIRPVCR